MRTSVIDGITFNEICGAVHLHTTYSDGGVSFKELIDAAREIGLDYIAVTDHMTMDGSRDGYEGRHGDLQVIVGYEHNDRSNRNHYLVLGTDAVFGHLDCAGEYVKMVKEAGGIGFIAHPSEKRDYFGTLPPYPWTEWAVTGFDGIELWNQMSNWMEQLKSWISFIRLFYPRRFLSNIDPDLLARWDALNRTRFVGGIGGVDAHTRRLKFLMFHRTIFPIKIELKGIRTHLYLEESKQDVSKENIIAALKSGRGFISNFRRGDARGTVMFLEYPDGSIRLPGNAGTDSQKPPQLPAILHCRLPIKADVHFIRNGKIESGKTGSKLEFSIMEPGVYRLEIVRNDKAWIYSNPFPVGSYPL